MSGHHFHVHGAHFPADVLAGFFSSLLVVLFVRILVKGLYKAR